MNIMSRRVLRGLACTALAVANIASASFAAFNPDDWYVDPKKGLFINDVDGSTMTPEEWRAANADNLMTVGEEPSAEATPKAKKHSKLRGGAKARAKRRYARQKAAYAKLPKTKAEWQAVKADCTDEEKVLAVIKFENVLYDQLSPKEWLALKELKLIPSLPKLNRGGDLSSWNARILASHEDDVAHGRCVDLVDDTVGTAIKAVVPEASEEEMLAIGDKLHGQILVISEEGSEKGHDDIKTHARQDKLRVAKAEHKEAAEKGHGYYDPKALALHDMKKKRDKKKKVGELRAQGKTKKNKPQRAQKTTQERTEANRAKAAAKAEKQSKAKRMKKNPPRRHTDDSQVEPLMESLNDTQTPSATPIKQNPPIEPVRKAARAATKAQNTLKEVQEKYDAIEQKATEEYKAGKRPELKGKLGRKRTPEERKAKSELIKAHREARRKQEDAKEAAYQALKAKDPKAALKAWNDGDIEEAYANAMKETKRQAEATSEESKVITKEKVKAQEEEDRKAEEKEEAKRQAKADAKEEAKRQEEADRKAQEEADRKAQEEADRKAQEEADRKAQEEADRKAAEKKAEQEAYLKTSQTLTDEDMDAMEADFIRTHPKLATRTWDSRR
jgi:hypothetical protein